MRAGPEYIIRKYTFFENGTFLLLRYHYDDMSCSMPTHTVSIWGSIKLVGPSSIVSGATETKVHVDAVYITPLNRQVCANGFWIYKQHKNYAFHHFAMAELGVKLYYRCMITERSEHDFSTHFYIHLPSKEKIYFLRITRKRIL